MVRIAAENAECTPWASRKRAGLEVRNWSPKYPKNPGFTGEKIKNVSYTIIS
jgi:hypothetical protein